ncbi:hypothetical protein BURCENBC7_AP6741 [Burkholderia cenocepacia BC7]|nr:hypothetical protein BURCENBC7_AP6741 [Burkholderia cenocepacia BC7]
MSCIFIQYLVNFKCYLRFDAIAPVPARFRDARTPVYPPQPSIPSALALLSIKK